MYVFVAESDQPGLVKSIIDFIISSLPLSPLNTRWDKQAVENMLRKREVLTWSRWPLTTFIGSKYKLLQCNWNVNSWNSHKHCPGYPLDRTICRVLLWYLVSQCELGCHTAPAQLSVTSSIPLVRFPARGGIIPPPTAHTLLSCP